MYVFVLNQILKCLIKKSTFKIDVLETAFWQYNYPDVDKVEQLCKGLGISKEKINVSLFSAKSTLMGIRQIFFFSN